MVDLEAILGRVARAADDDGRPVVFLLGSALTAPAAPGEPGVPGVSEMVQIIRDDYHHDATALRSFEDQVRDASNPYQAAFEHVLIWRGADHANRIIRRAVLRSRRPAHMTELLADAERGLPDACNRMENDLDGWVLRPGVEALGKIIAEFGRRFGSVVLTTNFDPLISISIRRACGTTWRTTFHGDGNLFQSHGQGCHAVHLHGYWFGADTLHAPHQLRQERPQLESNLATLLRDRTLVVIGYGGWDDLFVNALGRVVADESANPDVVWAFFGTDPVAIQATHAALLAKLTQGRLRGRVAFFGGVDCHAFLPRLYDALARTPLLAAPAATHAVPPGGAASTAREDAKSPFVVGPPIVRDEDFFGRRRQREELFDALDRRQPTQILGERRIGKSSLLRWVERRAPADLPVAWINAQGLDGRSPVDLVRAAARALGKMDAADACLYTYRDHAPARAAERALSLLCPALLLVDEAEALARPDHGFDRDFLDTLRALGQEADPTRRLVWISASRVDLRALFVQTASRRRS